MKGGGGVGCRVEFSRYCTKLAVDGRCVDALARRRVEEIADIDEEMVCSVLPVLRI